ncbi:hypothetical protein HEL23_026170 [Escherichia coli]|nr:hypothetical protein [Escherichia coli]MBB8072622.1 hypothetical protein [Escherichia coli]
MFDDCYFRARQWALGQTTVAERKTKKKPGQIKGASPTFSDLPLELTFKEPSHDKCPGKFLILTANWRALINRLESPQSSD